MSPTPDSATVPSRRDFVRKGAAAAAALPVVMAVLSACDEKKATPLSSDSKPAVAPPASPRQRAVAMDAMHEKGVKAFPAKTNGKGNQLLEPRVEKGVKIYDLTAEELQWEIEPGRKTKAWAYNGQVPGPQIRVREGDRVRLNLTNKLPESTADPLPRARGPQRSGWRPLHHPTSGYRLAHVSLPP